MSVPQPSLGLPAEVSRSVFVGVEVHSQVIRTAVFTPNQDLLGKMKLSTKPERGLAAVLERIARCVRYALDECDIALRQVGAIGVALPAELDADGQVISAPGLGWKQAPVRGELEAMLGVPVWTGNTFSLATWAIQRAEVPVAGASLAAVFPGGILGAGLVIDGRMQSLSHYPEVAPLLPPGSANIISHAADEQFRQMRPRDFRRAIRKGQLGPEKFLRESVVEAAHFASILVRRCAVSRLALGGGAIDENRGEMLEIFRAALLQDLGDEALLKALNPFVSELGDLAGLKGAAIFATEQQHLGTGSTWPNVLGPEEQNLQDAR